MPKNWKELNEQTQPLLQKYYPDFKSVNDYAKEFLKLNLHEGDSVLDLGCGIQSEAFADYQGKIRLVGVDYPLEVKDQFIDEYKQADLNKSLPLSDSSFNLVYSRFVVEHLQKPEKTYQEVYRILKPGGYFILMTPNIYNPIIFLSKMLPSFLHKKIKSRLSGTEEAEVFPTYYHSNRRGQIRRQLEAAGFKNIKIVGASGSFEYFMRFKSLFLIAVFKERLTDYIFKFTKIHLFIVCQK